MAIDRSILIALFIVSAQHLVGCTERVERQTSSPAASAVPASTVPKGETTKWVREDKPDPLTDRRTVTASVVGDGDASSPSKPAFVARCSENTIEVFVSFSEFLNSNADPVPVRYRFDQGPVTTAKWSTSTKGTAIFVDYFNRAPIVRAAITSKSLIVEAEDYRGTPHRASFDLHGAKDALSPVLAACKFQESPLHTKINALRSDVGAELEVLGPKQIETFKQILASLGGYGGAIDNEITPDFALSAQALVDEHVALCKKKYSPKSLETSSTEALNCFVYYNAPPLTISSAMYARAKGKLREQAGKLKRGD